MSKDVKKRTYRTRIGTPTSDVNRLRFRGKDTLKELIDKASFTEMIYLAVTGRMPTPQQTRILDACLVMLLDHGITPSALVARLVAESVPTDIQVPVAAGLLMIGNKYMGTIGGASMMFSEGAASGKPPAEWAADFVARRIKDKQRFPGYGHPAYSVDPRTKRLLEVADAAGLEGRFTAYALAIEAQIARQAGKALPLNATGTIGAMLLEIGFPIEGMRGVGVISRSAGLVAHAMEELEDRSAAMVVALAQDAIPYHEDV
jgi:citrate synthase